MQAGPVTLPNPAQAVHNIYDNIAAGLQYHEHECHSHPYSSVWYTWPIMEHPVLFYYPTPSSTQVWSITDMGNPAVWWPAIPALLFCAWRGTSGPNAWRAAVGALGVLSLVGMILIFQASQRYHDPSNFHTSYTAQQFSALFHRAPTPSEAIQPIHVPALFDVAFAGVILFAAAMTLSAVVSRRFVPAFIVLGFITAWMMWVPGDEARVLFFYHALGMLIFSALALAYTLTALRRARVALGARSVPFSPLAYVGVVAVVASFAFFYPVWTGGGLSPADHAMRIWVDTP
jgi:dolichyl-phosphate-mannose--protein O-mannosyl transferase